MSEGKPRVQRGDQRELRTQVREDSVICASWNGKNIVGRDGGKGESSGNFPNQRWRFDVEICRRYRKMSD